MRKLTEKALSIPDITVTPVNSAAIDTNQIFNMSVQVIATGSTPAGALKMQVSNDQPPSGSLTPAFVPTNWTDLAAATVSVTDVGTYLIPQQNICYNYVRLVWTFSSGTGTIKAQIKTNGM